MAPSTPSKTPQSINTALSRDYWILDKKYIHRMDAHRYKCEDNSILAPYLKKYFYYPLVDNCFPERLAPNLVTVIGFIPMIFVAIYCAVNDPLYINSDSLSPWFFLLAALSMFFYQTMDNCDGRQARNTGSSSVLGQLFDHGLDCINTVVANLFVGSVFFVGRYPPFFFQLVLLCGSLPFFTSTLEEYFTHSLRFPLISGPIEGIFALIGAILTAAIYGPEWWYAPTFTPEVWSMVQPVVSAFVDTAPRLATMFQFLQHSTRAEILIGLTFILSFSTIWSNFTQIFKYGEVKKDGIILTAFKWNLYCIPAFLTALVGLLWSYHSPELFINCPRALVLSNGLYLAQYTMNVMIHGILHIPPLLFHPYHFALGLAIYNCEFLENPIIPPTSVPVILAVIMFFHHSWFMLAMFHDISTYLDIKIFNIDKQLAINKAKKNQSFLEATLQSLQGDGSILSNGSKFDSMASADDTQVQARIEELLSRYKEPETEDLDFQLIPNPDNHIFGVDGDVFTTERGKYKQKLSRLASRNERRYQEDLDSENTDMTFSDVPDIDTLDDLSDDDEFVSLRTQNTEEIEDADDWARELEIPDSYAFDVSNRKLPPETPVKRFLSSPSCLTPRSDVEEDFDLPETLDFKLSPATQLKIQQKVVDSEEDPFFSEEEDNTFHTPSAVLPSQPMGHISAADFAHGITNPAAIQPIGTPTLELSNDDEDPFGDMSDDDDPGAAPLPQAHSDEDPFAGMSDEEEDGSLQENSGPKVPSPLILKPHLHSNDVDINEDPFADMSDDDDDEEEEEEEEDPTTKTLPTLVLSADEDPFADMSDDDNETQIDAFNASTGPENPANNFPKESPQNSPKKSPKKIAMGHISFEQFSLTQNTKSAHSRKKAKAKRGPQLIIQKDSRSPAGKKGAILITPSMAQIDGTVTSAESRTNMRFNPVNKIWTGEDHLTKRFEDPKPQLIAAKSNTTIKQVQLADGTFARWNAATRKYEFDNEEEDPFEDLDDDFDTDQSDHAAEEFDIDDEIVNQWQVNSRVHSTQLGGWFFESQSDNSSLFLIQSHNPEAHSPSPLILKYLLFDSFVSRSRNLNF